MPYVVSLLTVAAAGVALLILIVRLATPVHRLTGTARVCSAYLAGRIGLLRARIAGLKTELNRRRSARRTRSSSGPTAA